MKRFFFNMKTMNHIICRIAALSLTFVLLFGAVMPVLAADISPDPDQIGSVTVTMKADDGSVATDGALAIYRVADMNTDGKETGYTFVEAFSGCTLSLDDIEDSTLAASLAEWINQNNVTGTEKAVGKDGMVTFEDLQVGLYLVVQTTQSTGYYTISPFVVSVPVEVDGVWVYDVDAEPKMELYTEPTAIETNPPETTTTVVITILPQTGQLNWPIPLLAVAGIILLGVGWYMNRTDGRNKKNAE